MFKPFEEVDWNSHYDRPAGKEPVYHVSSSGQIRICQNSDWDRYLYSAEMDAFAQALAAAVNKCKARHSYNRACGGGFCINEFGIVIVPISTGGNGYAIPKAIGRWIGELHFRDGNDTFSLNRRMQIGDDWPYPYIGMKYHLAARNHIYYKQQADDGVSYPRPPNDNKSLIQKLRRIRAKGPMSFLVNNHGIVLAKEDENWQPKYVGIIDFDEWYADPLDESEKMDSEAVSDIITRLNRLPRDLWSDKYQYEQLLAAYWKNNRTLSCHEQQQLLLIYKKHIK